MSSEIKLANRPEMCSEGEWAGNEEDKKLKGISLGDIRSVPFVLILGALWKPNTGGRCTNLCSLFTETPLQGYQFL